MADRGAAFCPACGPQPVEDARWAGERSRLFLVCGHSRLAELVHHRGFRWTLPAPPPGYRVDAVIVGPDGRAYPRAPAR